MTDREYQVGTVIHNTDDLPLLAVGTVIGTTLRTTEYPEHWTRVVNGYLCTKGNPGIDLGHLVENDEIKSYFEPGTNEVIALPSIIAATTIRSTDNPQAPWVDTGYVVESDGFGFADTEYESSADCNCNNCGCAEGVKAEDVEAEGPKEFVPLYPNDPDNPNKETPRQDVLREAEHLVSADRNQAYGEPTDNFATIAEMATSRFRHLLRPGARFVGSDIGDFQIITKLARNVTMKKRDSYTDMAGYAACGYECTLNED